MNNNMSVIKKFSLLKKIVITIIMGLFGLLIYKQSNLSKKVAQMPTITVGMMSGWDPYMTINKKGEFVGFDVDVAKEVATRLGKKLVINDMGSLSPLFIALNQNKIDMIFSGLDITKKRKDNLEMVQYTGEGIKSFKLLFWKTIPNGVTRIEDLTNIENNSICVEPASPSELFLNQKQFKGLNKKSIGTVTDMILELKFGKSTAAILEPIIVERLKKKNRELKTLNVPLSEDFQIFGVGIAIKKGNFALKQRVAKAIADMREDGTLAKFERKWNVGEEQS